MDEPASGDDEFVGEGSDGDGSEDVVGSEDDGSEGVEGSVDGEVGSADGEGTVIVGVGMPGAGDVVGSNSVGGAFVFMPGDRRVAGAVPGTCGHWHPIASHPAGNVRKFVVMNTLRKSPLIAPSTESGNG